MKQHNISVREEKMYFDVSCKDDYYFEYIVEEYLTVKKQNEKEVIKYEV